MDRKLAALLLTLALLIPFAPARAEGTVCDTLGLLWNDSAAEPMDILLKVDDGILDLFPLDANFGEHIEATEEYWVFEQALMHGPLLDAAALAGVENFESPWKNEMPDAADADRVVEIDYEDGSKIMISLFRNWNLLYAAGTKNGEDVELGWYVILKSTDFSTIWTFLDVAAARD